MIRRLLILVPWMAMAVAAYGQIRSADVVYTYLGTIPERAVRVGDDCYVPIDFLKSVGWQGTVHGGSIDIDAEGRHTKVSLRSFSDRPMIPLSQVLDGLGLAGDWRTDANVFQVYSPITSVTVQNGHVAIVAGLDVKAKVSVLKEPNRLVIDLVGARLKPETKLQLDNHSKVGQFNTDVARIVLETEDSPTIPKGFDRPNHSFMFDIDQPVEKQPEIKPNKTDDFHPPTQISTPPPVDPKTFKVTAGPLKLALEGPTAALLQLTISGPLPKAPTYRRPDPRTLEIVLPNVAIDIGDQLGTSPSIEGVDTRVEGENSILSLKLARPMGIEFSTIGNMMQIQLLKPSVGNGRLAGKIVVIDAGHGGHDDGTTSPDGGVKEKNLTLAIAKLASEELAREGATVIMTRKTDVFIPLTERPGIANRNGADFFVSIHINSNRLNDSATGSITFHHKGNPISQLLADCIETEIKKSSGLPAMGVWSDGKIYENGFAVLRDSKMPAVLIECGFLNNSVDRKRMQTPEFQKAIAQSIVRGLRVYLGDDKAKS